MPTTIIVVRNFQYRFQLLQRNAKGLFPLNIVLKAMETLMQRISSDSFTELAFVSPLM